MSEKVMQFLQKKVSDNAVVHAYVFIGGGDLLSYARRFAMMLNCLDQTGLGNACEMCTSCMKIINQAHPDITILVPDGNTIKIEQIRDLQKKLSFRRHEGRYRVVMMEHANHMTLQAANSLLKTLEEPLPYTVFILTADSTKGIPDTILSRCQRIDSFSPEELDSTQESESFADHILSAALIKRMHLIDRLEKEDTQQLRKHFITMMKLLRNAIALKACAKEDPGDLTVPEMVYLMEKISNGLKELDYNYNRRLFLEDIFYSTAI